MAERVVEGCRTVEEVDARSMSIDDTDKSFLADSSAVIFGSPTYEGTCSWQMKKFLDTESLNLAGKLGAVFVSQNWPGGGGGSFAEMTIIAGLLVLGMLIYSGGITVTPYLHFGAVARKSPDEQLYRDRCITLGKSVTEMARKLFLPDE